MSSATPSCWVCSSGPTSVADLCQLSLPLCYGHREHLDELLRETGAAQVLQHTGPVVPGHPVDPPC